ncbi:MAG: peptidase rane alanine aminopeptidase, partial [Candidatus Solibacter sp.]|nr:peptidase rane alanine aminopeptidase [Candidatus Solibacter sp.]
FILLAFLLPLRIFGSTAADIARAVRENSFDRDECYRVRDLTFVKEDIRLYLTEGHLIFSKPIAGRRVAAIFSADVEGGDGEVILFPPDRAERRSLSAFVDAPNLDEHFRAVVLLFTGDVYEQLKQQIAANSGNRKSPEVAPLLDQKWSPVLRNLGTSYQVRLTLDLLGAPARGGLLAALFSSSKLGNFDIVYDPDNAEQIMAGQVNNRENRLYFDTWTSFPSRSSRKDPKPVLRDAEMQDYRIDATVTPELSLNVVTRVKVRVRTPLPVLNFDIAREMSVSEVRIDGAPAEVLQGESVRVNLTRGGNNLFLVVPASPLQPGRDYEFEFRHSGKVIHDAGDHVFYVSARANWYPASGLRFANYDLTFRFPREYDLVGSGDVIEDRTEGDTRVVRRRPSAPIRIAAFNLGDYTHARLERGGYVIDVCANRKLETALQPRPASLPQSSTLPPGGISRRRTDPLEGTMTTIEHVPSPIEHLQVLAEEVASAMEFMASKFGPPALPHLTVSPIPGTFGQGFPGLIYLSTLSYFKSLPGAHINGSALTTDIFFGDVLQAHETAHQWWGNRVTAATYRDNWLMEALANTSALLYLEKRRGTHSVEQMLDTYRAALLAKNESGQPVDSAGPIVLGTRLETSQEPRAWRTITYGKGSWIMQMLRARVGTERFIALLAETVRRYDRKEITTEEFRLLAASFLPPKSDDPKLESFFEQWVYGTGIPTMKLTYSVKGVAPNVKLTGTLTQSGVDEDFTTSVPVEIQIARGKSITQWVRSADVPVTFTVPLKAAPLKVTLDPHYAVLRK